MTRVVVELSGTVWVVFMVELVIIVVHQEVELVVLLVIIVVHQEVLVVTLLKMLVVFCGREVGV